MASVTLEKKIIALRDSGLSFSEIGKTLRITKDSARGYYIRSGYSPSQAKTLPKLLSIKGDAVIAGDIHVVTTQHSLIKSIAQMGEKYQIPNVIIAGDLFNMDLFSSWTPSGHEVSYSQEEEAARKIFRYLLGTFDNLYYMKGNHDDRFFRKLNGQSGMESLAKTITPGTSQDRVHTTDRNYMDVYTQTGKWRVVHQYQYSVDKLKVGRRLAAKYQCHIITHHQHHCAVGMSDDNKYTVVDNGCLAQSDKVAYKEMNINTMPEWNIGFGVLKDGRWIPCLRNGLWGEKI